MANDLNDCKFIGRLGKDPEMRYMANGKAVANFSIAVGSQWKDKQSGQKQESTEWVDVSAFDKLGEICGEYLKKGSQVFVSGEMKTRKWQDNNGNDRYSTGINANRMQMLGSRGDSGGANNAGGGQQQAAPQQSQSAHQQNGGGGHQQAAQPSQNGGHGGAMPDDWEDDVPF